MSTASVSGRVLLVLGSSSPVDPQTIDGFCQRWSGALAVPFELAKSEEAVANGDVRGVVVDADSEDAEAALVLAAETGIPAALVSTRAATDAPGALDTQTCFRIAGRGIDGYRWGALYVLRRAAWPVRTLRFGQHPEQVGDLRVPSGEPPYPAVVLVHGGGWKDIWRRDILEGLAIDLAQQGFASWNLDFRRVGPSGGGWPGTFDDIDAGMRALTELDVIDRERLALVGHSSGGQLALTQAARWQRAGLPGLRLAVSMSGVLDLVESARRGLVGGETIVHRLMGGSPDEVPERYEAVSPLRLAPLGVPQLLVQGLLDYIPDLVDLNRLYLAAATASGDAVELLELADVDHLGPMDPEGRAWQAVRPRLAQALAGAAASRSAQ